MEHVLLCLTYSMIYVFVDILKKVRFSLTENFPKLISLLWIIECVFDHGYLAMREHYSICSYI